jgi:uncharacterized protein (TIGR02300 family)
MATNKERGTKRTCQNGDCGARFYDLNRNPILCPICGSKYAIAHASAASLAAAEDKARKAKKPEYQQEKPEAEADTEEALVDVEADEADDTGTDEADETFLEEEEDEGNVSDIVGGPTEGEEEP